MKKPPTHRCCECEKKRERCLPVVRCVDGSIDYCCPQCWRRFDYDDFLYEHKQNRVAEPQVAQIVDEVITDFS